MKAVFDPGRSCRDMTIIEIPDEPGRDVAGQQHRIERLGGQGIDSAVFGISDHDESRRPGAPALKQKPFELGASLPGRQLGPAPADRQTQGCGAQRLCIVA